MADKGDPPEQDGPSLELPSFGFGRKKKAKQQASAPEPAPPAVEPEPVPAPDIQPVAQGAPLFVEDTPSRGAAEAAESTDEPVDREPVDREPARSGPRRPTLPELGPTPAALVTGLLVGIITVGMVWLSFRLCELIGGTSSCGNPGFLLLVAIFVVAALLGGRLLAAFGVTDGTSTSFLAMGVVAVVLTMVPGSVLFAWWIVIAVPVVAMPSYVLAHRLTTTMVEPSGREMHR